MLTVFYLVCSATRESPVQIAYNRYVPGQLGHLTHIECVCVIGGGQGGAYTSSLQPPVCGVDE